MTALPYRFYNWLYQVFLLATVPSSVPGKPKCSHTTLFEVLLGTVHEFKAAIFSTSLPHAWPTTMWEVTLQDSNSGSHNTCCISFHNISVCCTTCIAGVLHCNITMYQYTATGLPQTTGHYWLLTKNTLFTSNCNIFCPFPFIRHSIQTPPLLHIASKSFPSGTNKHFVYTHSVRQNKALSQCNRTVLLHVTLMFASLLQLL